VAKGEEAAPEWITSLEEGTIRVPGSAVSLQTMGSKGGGVWGNDGPSTREIEKHRKNKR